MDNRGTMFRFSVKAGGSSLSEIVQTGSRVLRASSLIANMRKPGAELTAHFDLVSRLTMIVPILPLPFHSSLPQGLV
jgi:hypothetical protein